MKRKIALLLTVVMTLASINGVSVFASGENALPGDTNGEIAATEGTSGVKNIDMIQYRVVLPTTKALSFTADPQGLAQLGSSGERKIGELTGGKVYSNGEVNIANRSSVDVKVTTTVTATESDATTKVKLANATTAAAATGAEMSLAVVVSEPTFEVANVDAGTDSNDPGSGYNVVTETDSVTNKSGYALTAGTGKYEVEVPVSLKKAEYVAKTTNGTAYDYAVVKDSVGGAATFSIAGICSTKGWDSIVAADMPGITTAYKFEDVSAEDITWGTDTMKVTEDSLTTVPNLRTAPLILTDAADVSVTSSKLSIKLLGATEGANAAVKTNEAKITSVKVNNVAKTKDTDWIVTDDGVIEITGTYAAGDYAISVEYGSTQYSGKATAYNAFNSISATVSEISAKVVASGFDAEKLTKVMIGTQELTEDATTNGYTLEDDVITISGKAAGTYVITAVYNGVTYKDSVVVPAAPVFGTNNAITYTAGEAFEITYTAGSGAEEIADSDDEIVDVLVLYNGGTEAHIVADGAAVEAFASLDSTNNKITLTATTTSVLDSGEDIVITYKLKTANGSTTTKTVNVTATKNA